jgi:hypothetical protein
MGWVERMAWENLKKKIKPPINNKTNKQTNNRK